ncbi:MAG: PDZ domain-containing protein [Acidimicrobiia bacterium]
MLSVVGVLIVVAVVAGFLIHVPYVVISPGEATPLDSSLVTISGAPTYPSDNDVLFLTVRVTNEEPNVWRYITASLDPDVAVEERSSVVGCLTPEENSTYNRLLMEQSQGDAKKVALTRLGYTVTADPPRVTIVYTCPGDPAHGQLAVGDRLLAVDGQAVSDSTGLGDLVRARKPGDEIGFTVERDGTTRTTNVVAGRLVTSKDEAGDSDGQTTKCERVGAGTAKTGTACIGAASQGFVTYHFPIDVTIAIDRVGGPSAGLAFTLAIIDDLTPGALTDGKRVAVTGSIASDGTVQLVGGIEQKAITARRNGVQLMLVPKAELAAARKGADGMKVVGVDTIDDALAALQQAGGVPVPPVLSTAARS